MAPRYSEEDARAAIAGSSSYAEALRAMGMCCTGNAYLILCKHAQRWGIPTDHFDPNRGRANLERRNQPRTPLAELLVEGRFVKSATLKQRLYAEGLKERRCELCGQGEDWNAGTCR